MARPVLTNEQRARSDRHARRAIRRGLAQCILEKGYGSTTVADIARASRVSKTTVYGLFEDKEAIFLDLYGVLTDGQIEYVERVDRDSRLAGLPWQTRLATALRAYLSTVVEGGELARWMLVEAPAISPTALAARREALTRFGVLVHRLADQVQDDEGIEHRLSVGLITACVGTMNELSLIAVEPNAPSVDELASYALEVLGMLYVASSKQP